MKLYDVYGHGLLIFPIVGFVYNISFKWSLLSWSSTLRNGDHLICRSFFFEALQSWPTTIPQMSDALVGWVKTSIYRLRWLGPHSTNQYEAHFIRVPNRQSAFFLSVRLWRFPALAMTIYAAPLGGYNMPRSNELRDLVEPYLEEVTELRSTGDQKGELRDGFDSCWTRCDWSTRHRQYYFLLFCVFMTCSGSKELFFQSMYDKRYCSMFL